jgi:hypothetical protein
MVQISSVSEDMVQLESVPGLATVNDAEATKFLPANQVYLSDSLLIESVTELAVQCFLDLGNSKSMGTATIPSRKRYQPLLSRISTQGNEEDVQAY